MHHIFLHSKHHCARCTRPTARHQSRCIAQRAVDVAEGSQPPGECSAPTGAPGAGSARSAGSGAQGGGAGRALDAGAQGGATELGLGR